MYTIGQFSKIGNVSTKTLRYYDEIGLLHPHHIDENNGYRYYSEEQVDEILYILELKHLKLSLEQIKLVMKRKDESLLEQFLMERIKEIDNEMRESMFLRKCIKRKMWEIKSGKAVIRQNIELAVEKKEFRPLLAMSRTAVINIEEIKTLIGNVFESIFKNGLQPSGPVMTFYLDEEFKYDHAKVEVCIPVSAERNTEKITGVRKVAPGLCATCTYMGPYSKLGKAYAAVLKWIEENEYSVSSAPFDCYMNDPAEVKNSEELITQVWFPISKVKQNGLMESLLK